VAHGATLLAMTDGFYRLADPYGLYAPAQLVDACAGPGLAVKAADDAAAVMWTNQYGPTEGKR
jgi:hypothetical protein